MNKISMKVSDEKGVFAIISGTDIMEMAKRCKARWGDVKLTLCQGLAYGHDKTSDITITPVSTL